MPQSEQTRCYRFGVFEADAATGELRRKGMRVRLSAQPFQLLLLLLEHPGELLTREQICRELWPEGTFVDFEHGVNAAVNRIREALGDTAASPRFVETLARRGYRFIGPVMKGAASAGSDLQLQSAEEAAERPSPSAAEPQAEAHGATPSAGFSPPPAPAPRARILATAEDLPRTRAGVVRALFLLLQAMYLAFYVGALANLGEIAELMAALPHATAAFNLLVVTAAALIPARAFLICAVLFRAPAAGEKMLRIWPVLLVLDELWALSPFLLLHHVNFGVAAACTALLVYAPFAQRSLVLMGAAPRGGADEARRAG